MPEENDDQGELSEIDELINPASSVAAPAAIAPLPLPPFDPAPIATSTVATRSPQPAAAPRAGQPLPKLIPLADDDPPLFERDLDVVLGMTGKESDDADNAKAKPRATSGMDAMSLGGERGQIVLSSQKATALAVALVILLALTFGAGYLLGSK